MAGRDTSTTVPNSGSSTSSLDTNLSGETEAATGICSAIPNFAMIHTAVKDIDVFNDWYDCVQVSRITIPLILEIKRNATWPEDGHEDHEDIGDLLSEATAQVMKQAAYTFAMYQRMETLIATAASGRWWTYAVLESKDVRYVIEYVAPEKRTESPMARLCTPDSDERFEEVMQRLMEIVTDEIMD